MSAQPTRTWLLAPFLLLAASVASAQPTHLTHLTADTAARRAVQLAPDVRQASADVAQLVTEASKPAVEVADYRLYAQRETAAITARQYYYAYAHAVAAEQVERRAVEQLASHVADLHELARAGRTTRGDLLAAQAELADARVGLSAAQGAVVTLGDQLRIYLGLPAATSLVLDEDIAQPPAASEAPTAGELGARARRSRPEMLAQRVVIEAAAPSPRAVGRARTDLAELERRLANEASLAATAVHVAREQIAAAQLGVDAAREAWQLQRGRVTTGEATEYQALAARAALTRAEHALVDAQVAARIAGACADYVIGRATPN